MTTKTFLQRLGRCGMLKKNGEMMVKYKYVFGLLKDPTWHKNGVFHLKCWSRNGWKYTLYDANYWRMVELLDALGIKYETGNDAPKGGLEGDYIKVAKTQRNKLKDVEL